MVTRNAVLALCAAGCGARPHAAPGRTDSDQVALYRDRVVISQRVELTAPRAGPTTIALRIAAGVDPAEVLLGDLGELTAARLRIADAIVDQPAPRDAAVPPVSIEDQDDDVPPPRPHIAPGEVALDVTAPHAGRYAVTLGYTTDRMTWDAAYTMTTTAARDRAVVRGAIAIRNTTGIVLHAHTRVIDGDFGAWRDRNAEQLGQALAGAAASTAPVIEPCDLGVVELGDGETRVELLAGAAPRKLRSVLVYDPIGPGLDHTGAIPVSDPSIGTAPEKPGQVSESFEIDRDRRASRSYPAGPLRLFERHPDGSLALLGEARLFDAATRVADVDTVAIGTAQGVAGRRERRDWARNDEQHRFSEEFLLTIDNARPQPVELVLREHLYRGQNWTLAYHSAPAVKEGAQQIALRTTVPANGSAKVLYVVVYTW